MNIVIVGASGFIGSYLVEHLSKDHKVIPVYKDTVNVFDSNEVGMFLWKNGAGIVINCLSFGEGNGNNSEDVGKNLALFYSFYANQDLFKHYINIGSGSEKTKNNSAYAFSKKLISASMFGPKWFNLIVYGCFGKNEKPRRLLKQFLSSKGKFKIQNDRLFDFISIQDFANIVSAVVENTNDRYIPHTIVCTYESKIKISTFLSMFCDINNIEKRYEVESESEDSYTGYSNLHEIPGLNLYGIGHGMKEYII